LNPAEKLKLIVGIIIGVSIVIFAPIWIGWKIVIAIIIPYCQDCLYHIDKAFLNGTISDIMTNCLKMKETKRSSSGLVLHE
jgi:hypothetical protein